MLAHPATHARRLARISSLTDSPIYAAWRDEWTINLRSRLAPSSIPVHLRALHQFSDWLRSPCGGGSGAPQPGRPVARVKVDDSVISIPSDEDIRHLLSARQAEAPIDRRDNLLIRFLADAGVRRFEASGMDVDGLDLANREALVHGKGTEDRCALYGDNTAMAGMRWMRVRILGLVGRTPR